MAIALCVKNPQENTVKLDEQKARNKKSEDAVSANIGSKLRQSKN